MIPKTRRALLVASTLVALAVATFAFAAWQRSSLPDDPPVDRGGSGLSTGRSGGSSGKGSGAAPSAAAWKEIDQLIKEQKFAAAIEKAGLTDKVSHVSTGGGAASRRSPE